MKTCPVCQALTFDDADVCYGCLYRFGIDSVREQISVEDAGWEPDDGVMRGVPAPGAERGKVSEKQEMPEVLKGTSVNSPSPFGSGQVEAVDRRSQEVERVVHAFACGDGVARGEQVRECGTARASESHGGKHASLRAAAATARPISTTASPTSTAVRSVSVDAHPDPAAARPRSAACPESVVHPVSATWAAPFAPPFNHAGWIVRFELPGCVPRTVLPHSFEVGWEVGAARSVGEVPCDGAREGVGEVGWSAANPLVISISPAQEGSSDDRNTSVAVSALPYSSPASCERVASAVLEGGGAC